MANKFILDEQLIKETLDYHQYPRPGKTAITVTKPIVTPQDLSLAYTPGVAAPCIAIQENPNKVYDYTNKSNLVAVITNGSAILGLGNIGALAGKPVMEGKAVLFKKCAGIDVFDIEINEDDPEKLVSIIKSLEPTFGGINLEDIKSPECFTIEEQLIQKLQIPVFHDDQHGTAIVVAAGIINSLKIVNKKLSNVKIVISGAGAAAIACINLLIEIGADRQKIFVCDSKGLIHNERTDLHPIKQQYIQHTSDRTLSDVMMNADIFIGLSGPNTVTQNMIAKMAEHPIIFALANPIPEILPELITEIRSDAIIATGRSDYPNQINNVLCFPYIFRGALDVGATCINEEMKIAAVHAIADLATAPINNLIVASYNNKLSFGKDYIIPKPMDPRLITAIAPAVALAAMNTKIATRPIPDISQYIHSLNQYICKSNILMKPLFISATTQSKHIVLCEGENESVLHATQEILDQNLAKITLIGDSNTIHKKCKELGLNINKTNNLSILNHSDIYWQKQISDKKINITNNQILNTIIGALGMTQSLYDGLICGTNGLFHEHLHILQEIIGCDNQENTLGAMNALILPTGNLFITDTFVNRNPTINQLHLITINAINIIKNFDIIPRVALLSHSHFGTDNNSNSAEKMRLLCNMLNNTLPDIEIDGEMQADVALSSTEISTTKLTEIANLLVMPNIESANIAYNMLKISAADGITVGPILMGLKKPAHILNANTSVRRIVNMVTLTAANSSNSSPHNL